MHCVRKWYRCFVQVSIFAINSEKLLRHYSVDAFKSIPTSLVTLFCSSSCGFKNSTILFNWVIPLNLFSDSILYLSKALNMYCLTSLATIRPTYSGFSSVILFFLRTFRSSTGTHCPLHIFRAVLDSLTTSLRVSVEKDIRAFIFVQHR